MRLTEEEIKEIEQFVNWKTTIGQRGWSATTRGWISPYNSEVCNDLEASEHQSRLDSANLIAHIRSLENEYSIDKKLHIIVGLVLALDIINKELTFGDWCDATDNLKQTTARAIRSNIEKELDIRRSDIFRKMVEAKPKKLPSTDGYICAAKLEYYSDNLWHGCLYINHRSPSGVDRFMLDKSDPTGYENPEEAVKLISKSYPQFVVAM